MCIHAYISVSNPICRLAEQTNIGRRGRRVICVSTQGADTIPGQHMCVCPVVALSCMLRTCGDDVERWDRAAAVPYLATSVRPHPRCPWANQSTDARTSSGLIYVPIGASAAFTVRGLHRLCSPDAPSERKMRCELVFHRNVQVWLHTTELSLLLNAICDATDIILTLIPGKRSLYPSLLSGLWYFSIA